MKKLTIIALAIVLIFAATLITGQTFALPAYTDIPESIATNSDTVSFERLEPIQDIETMVENTENTTQDSETISTDTSVLEEIEDVTPDDGVTETFPTPETDTITEPDVEETVHVHNNMTTVIPATCTTAGYSEYTCVDCNYSCIVDVINPVGHEYGEWTMTQQPTCITEGIRTRTCKHCGFGQTERLLVPGHDFVMTEVAATCTQDGYIMYQCKRCGTTKQMEVLPAVGHQFNGWYTAREATTTNHGVRARNCTRCGYEETTQLPTKAAVNIAAITPTDLFDSLTPEEHELVNLIIDTVAYYYDNNIPQENRTTRVAENHGLSFEGYYRVCSQLCFYYGVYYEIWEYMEFYYGAYQWLYIDMDVFCELEANHRAMMSEIDKAIATFAAGSEEELVMQACNYICGLLKYDKNQADAAKTFTTKTGSCNAYSILLRLMLHRLGISSDFITGYASSGGYHAWVQVRYSNGSIKYYDLTVYESTRNAKWLGATELPHTTSTINRY